MGKKRTHKKGSKTKSRSVKRRTKSRSVKRRTKSRSSGKRERKRQTSKKVMKGGGKIMKLNANFTRSEFPDIFNNLKQYYLDKGTKDDTYCVFNITNKHRNHHRCKNQITYDLSNTADEKQHDGLTKYDKIPHDGPTKFGNFTETLIDKIKKNTKINTQYIISDFTYAIRCYPNTVCPDYGSYRDMSEFVSKNPGLEPKLIPKLIPTELLSDIDPE